MAAIAAAQTGRHVALVTPGKHVGGMVTGGLSHTDYGNSHVIGGLALEFYERIHRHYGAELWSLRGPEPHVAEHVMLDWLAEVGVDLYFDAGLVQVTCSYRRIQHIVTTDGRRFAARVFVDASYEGDLMAQADVSYVVGRESVDDYGERWAGRQPSRPDKHNFKVAVSPFVNGKDGALLPLMHDRPVVREGVGDQGVQAYCFRLCLTDNPDNRIPFPEPDEYDPAQFELLKRLLAIAGSQIQAGTLMSLSGRLPNNKIDVNSIGPISTNLLDGSSWQYPDADNDRRHVLWNRHLRYAQGLLYFLSHDPSSPDHIRREMNRWGLCCDEFVDTAHWPHQLYIRDARRMRGEYWMTQHDLETARIKYDVVAIGSYNIDIREVQRTFTWVSHYPHLVGEVFNEGYLSIPVQPYAIPYRALVPQYHECENLLVPVCLSASHVAFASIRMEPQYMMLGHVVGLAAALAVKESIPVQRVNIGELQRLLVAQRQVLE
jgi:hypothetical protein